MLGKLVKSLDTIINSSSENATDRNDLQMGHRSAQPNPKM